MKKKGVLLRIIATRIENSIKRVGTNGELAIEIHATLSAFCFTRAHVHTY